jgi:hypothetical protein
MRGFLPGVMMSADFTASRRRLTGVPVTEFRAMPEKQIRETAPHAPAEHANPLKPLPYPW